MSTTFLEILLGAIVAILITIWVENLRKPKLTIRITPPADRQYEGRPARQVRFLSVEVINHPLPKWAQWMSRGAATQCHGTITFHHLDGQNLFGRAMPARWSASPEPVATQFVIDGKTFLFVDPSKFTTSLRMDIYPGEVELLNIAGKFDDDADCYGWSNESYFSDPVWRNPNWRLPVGRYLVKVVVNTAGEKVSSVFRLINDVPRTDFRLEPTMPKDSVYG